MARTRTIRRAPRKATSKAKTKKTHTIPFVPDSLQAFVARRCVDIFAMLLGGAGLFIILSLTSYNRQDPSWNTAANNANEQTTSIANWMGHNGAITADLLIQTLGAAGFALGIIACIWAMRIFSRQTITAFPLRIIALLTGIIISGIALAQIPFDGWNPQPYLGGSFGTLIVQKLGNIGQNIAPIFGHKTIATLAGLIAIPTLFYAADTRKIELAIIGQFIGFITFSALSILATSYLALRNWIGHYNDDNYTPKTVTMFKDVFQNPIKMDKVRKPKTAPKLDPQIASAQPVSSPAQTQATTEQNIQRTPAAAIAIVTPEQGKTMQKAARDTQQKFSLAEGEEWEFPPINLLEEAPENANVSQLNEAALRKNAELLQNVLADFNIEGDITSIHPGPVVTLYELEPAPGTKSSKVISLADDIARSMSAISVRVAVVPGRNVIGIELPNKNRQIVYMQELIASQMFEKTKAHLPLILGKDIGGQPILADLAKMPHLLVAGTTGSGKSVAVNTMILSILYGLSPEKCRFIMIDPKMLELSVYDGIPHLLSPVVTEPGKAVVALKWTVHEMEDRYRAMSKLGVRNIEGYNQRVRDAKKNGETIINKVQTGFDPDTGDAVFEDREMSLEEIPYIVVVVDEFADLMLVAGKDVESAIQRLAQMARAAGIHLIMATQRPSVDVITGVIKANFPTRISFQVTSKVDSRTILGEGGAEQLLGMGDMLYMAPGGRITRVHGPFVSDSDVEKVVDDLKSKASPAYIENITDENSIEGSEVMNAMFTGGSSEGNKVDELYDEAVAIVAREGKASTSFIQRCLQIGYNRAARIIEEMEKQGVVTKANATGKREVLVSDYSDA